MSVCLGFLDRGAKRTEGFRFICRPLAEGAGESFAAIWHTVCISSGSKQGWMGQLLPYVGRGMGGKPTEVAGGGRYWGALPGPGDQSTQPHRL